MEEEKGLDINGTTYTNQDYLNFAQARRVALVQAFEEECNGPKGIVTLDPDRQGNYLAALRDLEKQVLTVMKLKQEEKNNDAQNAQIAALILKHSEDLDKRRSHDFEQGIKHTSVGSTVLPTDDVIPKKQVLPGELHIGDRIENYEEYMSRTGQLSSLDQDL